MLVEVALELPPLAARARVADNHNNAGAKNRTSAPQPGHPYSHLFPIGASPRFLFALAAVPSKLLFRV